MVTGRPKRYDKIKVASIIKSLRLLFLFINTCILNICKLVIYNNNTYGDSVFALAKGVPELDCAVARARNDLTVVSGEGNAQNVLLVVVELTGGLSSSKI